MKHLLLVKGVLHYFPWQQAHDCANLFFLISANKETHETFKICWVQQKEKILINWFIMRNKAKKKSQGHLIIKRISVTEVCSVYDRFLPAHAILVLRVATVPNSLSNWNAIKD